jgi:hypothetical protein
VTGLALDEAAPVELLVPEPADEVVGVDVVVVVGVAVVVVVGVLPDVDVVTVGVVVVLEAPEVVVVVCAATLLVAARCASAGSWPVTSSTAMTDHTPMNSATVALRTRVRITRTRSRRVSLILAASDWVMQRASGARVAAACGGPKNDV